MSKIVVIKKNEEFQSIFEKGHSIYGRYLVVYFLHTSLKSNRFGFCVGRKIGNAVIRNHIKRILREAVRANLIPDYDEADIADILLVARSAIRSASLTDIISEIKHILDKIKKIHKSTLIGAEEREGSQ